MHALININLVGTLHLNGIRILSATIMLNVLSVIFHATGIVEGTEMWITPLHLLVFIGLVLFFRLIAPLVDPLIESLSGLPVPIFGGIGGWIALITLVAIVPGDPLIWFIQKYYPNLIPMKDFKIINFYAIIMLYNDQ